MVNQLVLGLLIFVVAVVMTMVGKGGGNFYVVILALADVPMHQAATTGQFILFAASMAALVVFQRRKVVSWSMALLIGGLTSLSALGGGLFSHVFSGFTLKLVFSIMLVAAGLIMLIPVKSTSESGSARSFGIRRIKSGKDSFTVNLWIAIPVAILTGFGSGMVGVSGGSFLVPLMALACGMPMHLAVGTASSLIGATAFMGFVGHAIQGDFNPAWAIPLALVTVVGGLIGGRFALQTKPKNLKRLFAVTNLIAAGFMVVNALTT